jgi:hypothetical protein
MMKVLFLDIDGVLNSERWYTHRQKTVSMDEVSEKYPFYEIDPESVKWLNYVTDTTGAKIVCSSTWRLGRSVAALAERFKSVGITGEIIDSTVHFGGFKNVSYTIPRGCEIEYWLDQKKFQRINWSKEKQQEYLDKSEVKNYVIIDDDSDMLYGQREHFVKTPRDVGFDKKCALKCINILNKSIIDLYYPKK